MCGIAGFVVERRPSYEPRKVVRRMAESMYHRGPDDEGYLESFPAFLGHRRLKVIDLETGRQPFSNEDGTISVVLNGEIYNYLELRAGLQKKGHTFRSRSDAEVLVHLWEEVGMELPNHLCGMFAFAIWDSKRKELFLARDRMGQKPLYWTHTPEAFVFGSELKAVMLHPSVHPSLSPLSVRKYLLYDTVPSPGTIMENIYRLEPGTWLLYSNGEERIGRYWDITFPSRLEHPPPLRVARDRLFALLQESVCKRLIADVPLGIFLSGGIDSSIITALVSKIAGSGNVKTFSVGFPVRSFDESEYASAVATYFRTQHHSRELDQHTMVDLLPSIISRLDEPLADNSLIPTYFLSQFTRESVTVALGGDGGDELCLGYPTFQAHKIARWYSLLPRPVQMLIARLVEALPVSTKNISFDYQAKQFVRGMEYDKFSRHFVWIGSVPPSRQTGLLTPEFAVNPPEEVLEDIERLAGRCEPRDDFDLLTYLYSKIYLCDDVLAKVDRASMMHSLEARAPFLDHSVVEFFTSLPTSYKLRGFKMKYILKQTFGETLPPQIIKRKKKGFGAPVADWLKGDLRVWVDELFSPSNLAKHHVFEPSGVKRLWAEHLGGVRDHRKPLWSILVLLMWMEENMGNRHKTVET